MGDYMNTAAKLVRSAPSNVGDPLPSWTQLEKLGDLMRDAGLMLRQMGERAEAGKQLAEACMAVDAALACMARENPESGYYARARDELRAALAAWDKLTEGR
jgi:hypothetical protein